MTEGVHELRFPGQVPDDDVTVMPGGCQHGGGRCIWPAELEVYLPEIKAFRQACREHAGYFMLAGAGSQIPTIVLVRRIAVVPDAQTA